MWDDHSIPHRIDFSSLSCCSGRAGWVSVLRVLQRRGRVRPGAEHDGFADPGTLFMKCLVSFSEKDSSVFYHFKKRYDTALKLNEEI